MKQRLIATCIAFGLAWGGAVAHAQDEKFDITRFEVKGNTLLPPGQVDEIVAPFLGKGKVYGDIQKALEALENAYHAKGYGTVNVFVPEQEISRGVIRLDVTEAVLGKVTVTGNTLFDNANVRASLPKLKEGQSPNLRELSENIQLANENPAKQVEVTMSTGDDPNRVDAKVEVKEQNPQRVYVSLDNTGSEETGVHRLGVAYQNANLLGGDETLTLAYTTSPQVLFNYGQGNEAKVDIYSVAFRKPFYDLGDSLDVIYGNSSVNTPSAQATGFGLSGKGEVFALRWNHLFPRRGEYSSRLVLGYDYKHINTTCDGIAPGTTASCTPYVVQPVSATYSAQLQGVDYQASYNLGLAYNLIPSGGHYPLAGTGRDDRYSFVTTRPVNDDFLVARYGGSYARLVGGWQLRAVLAGQLAMDKALPSAEQFGVVGSTAVRGFTERAIATDSGHVINLEAYTPNLASHFNAPGNLHGVVFYDMGYGHNTGSGGTPYDSVTVASIGVGLRYSLQRDLTFSWDAANVLDAGVVTQGPSHEGVGQWRSHFKLTVGF